MGWLGDSGYWIGKHPTLGLVLIDGANDPGGPYLSVFIVTQNRMAEFGREHFELRGVNVSTDVSNAAMRAMQDVRLAESLDRKHKAFLSKNHLAAADIRRRSELLRPRKPRCFHCHAHLDSAIAFECVACGWILCDCGACGCTLGGGARTNENYTR